MSAEHEVGRSITEMDDHMETEILHDKVVRKKRANTQTDSLTLTCLSLKVAELVVTAWFRDLNPEDTGCSAVEAANL